MREGRGPGAAGEGRPRRWQEEDQVPPEVAWAIYTERKRLGMSRERLAERATERLRERGIQDRIVPEYIRRVEWGLVKKLRPARLQAIADVLGIDLQEAARAGAQGYPGPAWRHPAGPTVERIRLLRNIEDWVRRCDERELALLEEGWPGFVALLERLVPLVREAAPAGAGEPLTPEQVFEKNMGSLWRTPMDLYEWLARLLALWEEVVPWREDVRQIRETVLAALERRLPGGGGTREEQAGPPGG
jgi:transcriptional regulator with XRE-family HTH domain